MALNPHLPKPRTMSLLCVVALATVSARTSLPMTARSTASMPSLALVAAVMPVTRAQDAEELVQVEVDGFGSNLTEAKQNGLSEAVQRVVGTLLPPDVQLAKSEALKDAVYKDTSPFVEHIEVLTTGSRGPLRTVHMRVTVRKGALNTRLAKFAPPTATSGAASRPSAGGPATSSRASASAAAVELVTVEVEGFGESVGEAQDNALREAISNVVGTFVSAETQVEKDELLRDKIYTHSRGFVESTEKLSTGRRGDLAVVKMRVTVKKTPLIAAVEATVATKVVVDGQSLGAKLATQLAQSQSGAAMLETAIAPFKDVWYARLGEPSIKEDANGSRLVLPFSAGVDPHKWATATAGLVQTFDAVARTKGRASSTDVERILRETSRAQHQDQSYASEASGMHVFLASGVKATTYSWWRFDDAASTRAISQAARGASVVISCSVSAINLDGTTTPISVFNMHWGEIDKLLRVPYPPIHGISYHNGWEGGMSRFVLFSQSIGFQYGSRSACTEVFPDVVGSGGCILPDASAEVPNVHLSTEEIARIREFSMECGTTDQIDEEKLVIFR